MARMSIDDMFARDTRVLRLAKLCGWSRRETMGCLFDVWAVCYDRVTAILPALDIDLAAELDGFAEHLVTSGLAVRARQGLRVSGAEERIRYLNTQSESGRRGGLKSAETRRNRAEQASSDPSRVLGSGLQGSTNPSASASVPPSVPDPALVMDPEKNSASPSGSGSPPGSRKPKPSEPTASERDAAVRVLAKLSDRNGVRYSGTAEHVGLITRQLRAGVDEMHLRYVIAYCAAELGWADDAEMAPYLRPETLFGPKTLSKYLDAALTWVSKLPDDHSQPQQAGAA